MPPSAQLLLIVIALGGFWFIVMRPARRQQRNMVDLQRQLDVGDRVVISAGIFGTVQAIDDDRIDLEIAPGTTIQVARQVVVRRLETADDPGSEPETGAPADPETDPSPASPAGEE